MLHKWCNKLIFSLFSGVDYLLDLFEVLPCMLVGNIILQGSRDEPRLETKPVRTRWALNDGDLLRIKKSSFLHNHMQKLFYFNGFNRCFYGLKNESCDLVVTDEITR